MALKRLTKIFFATILLLIVIAGVRFLYIKSAIESKTPTQAAPSTTRFVDVSEEEIAYRFIDNHSDTTVVFVGGLSGWSGTWERTLQVLDDQTKNFNYLSLDLPPFGYSKVSADASFSRDAQADRIEGVIHSLNLKHVIMVGHSYGAGPSTEYVLRNDGRVKKLIVVDGVLNVGEVKQVSKRGLVQMDSLRDFFVPLLAHTDWFVKSRLKSFVYITDYIDDALVNLYTQYFVVRGTSRNLSNWLKGYVNDPLVYKSTSVDAYKKISIPVRLIWGAKDTLTPITGTEILLKSIPNVKLYTLTDVGHIPMIEDYTQFDTALWQALRE